MRVAFISNHPAPYRDAFLSRFVKASGLDVSVFSLFPNDSGHAFWDLKDSGYSAAVLAQYSESRWKLLWRLLVRFVFSHRYDFVVWPGIFCFYLKVPLLLCAVLGKKYAFVADSVKQPPIGKLGFYAKSYLVRHAKFIFVPGEASVRFFSETFGLSRNRIIKGAYALDGPELEARIDEARVNRDVKRSSLGLKSEDVVFLMVANMIKTRCYPLTSAAFIRFAGIVPNVKFIMVGNGEDFGAMKEAERTNECLRALPGCSFEEMLQLYAAADVYVHGGTEPASTALVIGAIAKLPVISSPAVGCYYDVVRDGETGFAVANYLDEQQWCDVFMRCLKKRTDWDEMGRRGRMLSRSLDVGLTVANFVAAIKKYAFL